MRGFSAVSACSTASATDSGGAPAVPALHGEPAERVDARAVELQRLGRRMRALARPDRRLDRPGLDDRHVDPPRRELDAQRVRHRLERELRHRVRAEERQRVQARDRAHVDDSAARRAQCGQAELRHPQLTDDVHLELAAQLVRRQELERPRDCDACVVDEAVQLDELERAADPSRRRATSSVPSGAEPSRRTPASTRQPRSRMRTAHAAPIPEDAPVTRTVLNRSRCEAMRARCFDAYPCCAWIHSARL